MTRLTGKLFVLTVLLAAHASAQIRGPMVGWVWDARQEAIRPILGITGSSVLGKALDLGFAVKAAAISGRKESSLLIGGDERAVYFVDLSVVSPATVRLDAAVGATSVTLSARGRSAAVWYGETKKLVILTGLGSAISTTELDLTVEGAPAAMAVNDDGALVLTAYPDSQTVLVIGNDGNRTRIPQDLAARGVAFLEESSDAVITTAAGLSIAKSVPSVTELALLVPGETFTAVAPIDARRVLLVDERNAQVLEVNVEDASTRQTDCPCTPTGLNRMTTSSATFRLNELSTDPLWLVEISDSGLRTVFVPPDPADPGTED